MSGGGALSESDANPMRHLYESEWVPGESLTCLADHFPGRPIVPAYCQLAYLRDFVTSRLGVEPSEVAFTSMKFLQPLEPDVVVHARAESKVTRGRTRGVVLSVSLSVSGSIVTQGEIAIR